MCIGLPYSSENCWFEETSSREEQVVRIREWPVDAECDLAE